MLSRTVINEHYFDHILHLWSANIMIDGEWIHVGHYVYEDDAIAAGIIAKLNNSKIKKNDSWFSYAYWACVSAFY